MFEFSQVSLSAITLPHVKLMVICTKANDELIETIIVSSPRWLMKIVIGTNRRPVANRSAGLGPRLETFFGTLDSKSEPLRYLLTFRC